MSTISKLNAEIKYTFVVYSDRRAEKLLNFQNSIKWKKLNDIRQCILIKGKKNISLNLPSKLREEKRLPNMKPFRRNNAQLSWWIAILFITTQIANIFAIDGKLFNKQITYLIFCIGMLAPKPFKNRKMFETVENINSTSSKWCFN